MNSRFLFFPASATAILMAAISFLTTASPAADDGGERHVFLLVGQSNMAGRAQIEAEDEGEIEGVELWNIAEKRWEPAKAPFNRYSPHRKELSMQRLNPGPTFAKAWRDAHPGVKVGIVCAVRGGTKIEEWEKGREKPWSLYDTALAATEAALAAEGKSRLVGILWHQGEGNSGASEAYPDQLKALVAQWRADLKSPELPFVFGQIGQWNPAYAAFNEMILKQSAAIPHTACVKSDGLTNMDTAHFDSKSQREFGRRYAAAMLSLTGGGE
ncbi:MAG: sialate O-acetylesterase [Verrucomicrobiae bacterium]|nr:sialate O-acetylesterase [Verrucomicrobiae bacterium]